MDEISRVLDAIDRGEPLAASELLPLVYDELRKLAAQKLAQEKPGQTLDPTALVHEAYLRLVEAGKNGAHVRRRACLGQSPPLLRRRRRSDAPDSGRKRPPQGSQKARRGARRQHADLDAISASGHPQEILALHSALEQFALREPLKAKLVELRYFGGLTLEQAAACLEISLSTADRAWRYARAWLYAAMDGADPAKF